MTEPPLLGRLCDTTARRDAIHIAVAPVEAAMTLQPGERIRLTADGKGISPASWEPAIGIVDPFLTEPVEPGKRFYLCLYPGTITSLRHVWTHPAFRVALPPGVAQLPKADAVPDGKEIDPT